MLRADDKFYSKVSLGFEQTEVGLRLEGEMLPSSGCTASAICILSKPDARSLRKAYCELNYAI